MKQTIKDALVEYGMAVLKNNEKTAKAILKKHSTTKDFDKWALALRVSLSPLFTPLDG